MKPFSLMLMNRFLCQNLVLAGSFILPFWVLFWSFLFNIDIKHLLFLGENPNAFNYASGTTFYVCNSDLLESDPVLAIEWLGYNSMKPNQDKYHLLILGHKYESVWANIGPSKIGKAMIKNLLESTLMAI